MDLSTDHKFDWEKDTWNVAEAYFADKKVLVKHQLDTVNDCIDNKIQKIVNEFNPIISYSNFNQDIGKYLTEYHVNFGEVLISKAIINDTDGEIKTMYPDDARLRNFTYSAPMICDITQKIMRHNPKTGDTEVVELPALKNIPIGKFPIMLRSKICALSEKTNKTRTELGECEYDEGGYFIINGSEKVIVSFEKKCENKIFVFPQSKGPSITYSHIAEITSVNRENPAYIKPLAVKLTAKEGNFFGRTIRVQITKVRADIPLFVLFRAFGIISDKQIIETIVYDFDNKRSKEYMEKLKPSLEEASPIRSKKVALEYISKYITITTAATAKNMQNIAYKLNYVEDIILNEVLPHVGKNPTKKAYFLGLMVRRLLSNFLGYSAPDDRDSFINKRVESPGALLASLFRTNFNKLAKDIKVSIDKDIKNGRIEEVTINLAKKIKANTIETGMKYALATGNWGIKNQPSKKGVAQVMNRLSYLSSISHRRRIIAPIERNAKQTAPRKLHNTQWMKACCCETPEGASIGIVKNMALTVGITIDTNPEPILECLDELDVIPLEQVQPEQISGSVNIMINGDWVGIHKNPETFVKKLREWRRQGIINIYTSIAWNIGTREVNIRTDAGRLTRPVYIVENNDLLMNQEIATKLRQGKLEWKDLLVETDGRKAIIEYIDTEEEDTCMIAMTYENLKKNNPKNKSFYRYTHCEIHPSFQLGVLASNIPFPDHNQAPRNMYQSAQGKQAIGVYATNFNKRMDTIGHILHYPQIPLVNTRASIFVNSNELPSGQNAIVAIACHYGYNQEDSLIMNQSALERGLFTSSSYRTHKDEEKKNQSTLEEEKFCKPEKFFPNGVIKTRGMKQGSYAKLDDNGLIKVGSKVEGNDVIIGKVLPLKQKKPNDPKFKDVSVTLKGREYGYVDWVYTNKNGEGYKFAKVRIRTDKEVEGGDKFSSRHGQKGTVGITFPQWDMPYTKDGIVPDIIVNPAAIPSRMTLGQLLECVLGKACALEGYDADSTPFTGIDPEQIADVLEKTGFERYGTETLYNGRTGEQIQARIFIGPTFYYRLKHLVSEKIHSRSHGPYQLLTKQPAEGRSRDGGLRFGEMERDCMLSHGAMLFLKERMFDVSDKYIFWVCQNCGMIAIANPAKNLFRCNYCGNTTNFSKVHVPYATKLFWQELVSMGIAPRMITGNN